MLKNLGFHGKILKNKFLAIKVCFPNQTISFEVSFLQCQGKVEHSKNKTAFAQETGKCNPKRMQHHYEDKKGIQLQSWESLHDQRGQLHDNAKICITINI